MKKVFMLLPVFLLCFGLSAFAATTTYYVNEYSTTSTSTDYMLASQTGDGSVWLTLDVGGGSGQVIWYNYGTEISRDSTPANGIQAPSGATSFKLTSLDGTTVYAIHGTTNNPNSPDITFDTPNATFNGGLSPTGDSSDTTYLLNQILMSTDNNGHGIGHLIDATTDVLNSTNANGQTLQQILDQITPSSSVDTGIVPASPSITDDPSSQDTRIEEWKPHTFDTFTDSNTYFTDQGDTTDQATPLPGVPDPSACWGDTCQQSEDTPDPSLSADPQQTQDSQLSVDSEQTKTPELTKDSQTQDTQLTQDTELTKDSQTQDIQLTQDTELTKDSQTQDTQLTQDTELSKDSQTQDPVPNQDSENTQDNVYTQDNFYSVTN